ncbi:PaaX family transcriptional regulator [Calidifontibacter sp. DB0510]|uniref:PaaX family transcriptional regulator n=1 Tax=Metallococcus carri TaxID=1656884 RepID=A0A967B0L7_9MICO|nr:PaaX family transcriptional regulator C-terminal domain-containing protein [Metallococcus carri]NHN55060.1 PaaX family transcriptional regulator [Metallococcus carri]NOP36137.1 PaaX family transcriptional regulator [Calidifontibacter sp. DB2511S]
MHARSAVFDVYGDHLLRTDGWASVAGLVRLTSAVDVAPAATRTAISRMVREGWLRADARAGARGYAMTDRARGRLASAWQRIYRADPRPWDGQWHVVVTDHTGDRSARTRLRASMSYLGYARLAPDTWIAPRPSDDLERSLTGTAYRAFTARFDDDPRTLAASAWDLGALAASHRRYLSWLDELAASLTGPASDEQVYAARALAVHEWRKFLFSDPDLPPEALPADWPGASAAERFLDLADRWQPRAAAYVEHCLQT